MAETPVSGLAKLQPELLLEIIHNLKNTPAWQQDLISWSSVSSSFRSLLAPYIFTSITLRNTEKSGSSVDLIAKGDFHQYVRDLYFEGIAPGDEEEGFSDTEGILPEIVESIISDLSRFPNLESVHINFPLDFEELWGEGFMMFQDEELPEERIKGEQEEAWRALNTRVYAAFAKNVNPGFKKLELKDLIPAEASSFSTPEFRHFLGQMTHFSLSCWTEDSSHYAENRRNGYVEYTQKYGELFFNNLSSATHLSISASNLPVLERCRLQVPLLESLHLDSIFLGSELKKFLASHAHTLKSIRLEDCHATPYGNYYPEYTCWSELFTALSKENPARLREFSVSPSHGFELVNEYHGTQEQRDEAALALEFLKAHPERRLFAHSYLDDKYGFRGDCQEQNLESFRLGNDQRAYDDLMRIVEKNAGKS